MSGIIIDVKTKAETANKELSRLNQRLIDIVNSSGKTGKALGQVSADKFKGIAKQIDATSFSFKRMGDTGSQALAKTNSNADTLHRTLGKVQTAALVTVSAFAALKAATSLLGASDNLTAVQNRLALVAGSTRDLTRRQQELYKVAQQTRTGLMGVADLYVDFSRSLASTGASEKRIISIVKTVQQAAILSGGSAESIRAAMTQLSQGLASGVVRGEEFNSVAEQMKYLLPGMAKAAGKTTAQMRAFANAGGLTTETFARLVEQMSAVTNQDFSKTTITFSQSLTVLRQSLGYFFGGLAQFTKFSATIGKVFVDLASGLDNLGSSIVDSTGLVKLSIKNFFDEIAKTGKAVVTLSPTIEVALPDVRRKARDAKMKAALERTQAGEIFKLPPPRTYNGQAVKAADDFADKQFSTIKKKLSAAASFVNSPFKTARDASSTIADSLRQVLKVFLGVVSIAEVYARKTAYLIPIIFTPIQSYLSRFLATIYQFKVNVGSAITKAVLPLGRNLQGFTEGLTGHLIADTRIERSWVRLAQSKSLNEFSDRLTDISVAADHVNTNLLSGNLVAKILLPFRQATDGVQRFLIAMNLMDNSIFRVSSVSMGRLQITLRTIANTFKMLYSDVIGPSLRPVLAQMVTVVYSALTTIKDTIRDVFDFKNGKLVGKALAQGLTSALANIGAALKGSVGPNGIFAVIYDSVVGGALVDLLAQITKSFVKFVSGFATGIAAGLTDVISFDKILGSVDSAKAKVRSDLIELKTTIVEGLKGLSAGAASKIYSYIPKLDFEPLTAFGKSILEKLTYVQGEVAKRLKAVADEIQKTMLEIQARVEMFKFKYNLLDLQGYETTALQDALMIMITMFEKLAAVAKRALSSTAQYVSSFGKYVKSVFYDIYDKVVGHSYWPDTMDGVTEYTKKLGGNEKAVNNFRDKVLKTFKSISDVARGLYASVGGKFSDIKLTVQGIDTGAFFKELENKTLSAIVAAFLLAFGGPRLKVVGALYMETLFGSAFLKSIGKILPAISNVAGKVAAEFVTSLSSGLKVALDVAIGSLPAFVDALMKGVLGANFFSSLFLKVIPPFNNSILQAITLVGGVMLVLKSKWQEGLYGILWGETKGEGASKKKTEGLMKFVGSLTRDTLLGIGQMVGIKPNPNGGKNLFAVLFGERKTAAFLAAGIMASTMLDSVSLLESLTVATPLLAFSMLGADNGRKLLSDIARFAVNVSATIYKEFASKSGSGLLGEILKFPMNFRPRLDAKLATKGMTAIADTLGNLMANGSGGVDFTTELPIAPDIGALSREFLKNTGDLFRNLKANEKEYSSGEYNLFTAMTTLKDGTKTRWVASFKDLWSATSGISTPLSTLWRKATIDTKVFGKSLKDAFLGTLPSLQALDARGLTVASNLKVGFDKLFTAILSGLRASRVAQFALGFGVIALVTAFASAAFAADKTAESTGTTKDRMLELAKSILATVTAVAALNVGLALLGKFRMAKAAFTNNAIQAGVAPLAGELAAAKIAQLASFKKTSRNKDTFDILKAQLGAQLDANNAKAIAAKTAELAANGVGRSGSTAAGIAGLFTRATRLSRADKGVAGLKTLGTMDFSKLSKVQGPINALDSIGTAVGLGGAAKNAAKSIGELFAKLLPVGGILKMIGGILGSVFTVANAIWLVVGAGVGLLGVWLFGRGDNIKEKLGWIYDKIRGILGLEPVTQGGREDAAKIALKTREFDGTTYDYTRELGAIDFSKMTPEKMAVFNEAINNWNTTLDTISHDNMLNGTSISDAQRATVDKAREAVERQIGAAEPEIRNSAEAQVKALRSVTDELNGFGYRVKRWFAHWGFTKTVTIEAPPAPPKPASRIGAWWQKGQDQFVDWNKQDAMEVAGRKQAIKKFFTPDFSQYHQTPLTARAIQLQSSLDKYSAEGTPEEKKRNRELVTRYMLAIRKAEEAKRTVVRTSDGASIYDRTARMALGALALSLMPLGAGRLTVEDPEATKRLRANTAAAEQTAGEVLNTYAQKMIGINANRRQANEFNKRLQGATTSTKEILGVDLGENGISQALRKSDLDFFDKATARVKLLKNEYNNIAQINGAGLKTFERQQAIARETATIEALAARRKESLAAGTTYQGAAAQLSNLTGGVAGLNTYRSNTVGGNKVLDSKVRALQEAIDKRDFGELKDYNFAVAEVKRTTEDLLATLSKAPVSFDQINAGLQSINANPLSDAVMAGMSPDKLMAIRNDVLAAQRAQLAFNDAANSHDISGMISQWQTLRGIISGINISNAYAQADVLRASIASAPSPQQALVAASQQGVTGITPSMFYSGQIDKVLTSFVDLKESQAILDTGKIRNPEYRVGVSAPGTEFIEANRDQLAGAGRRVDRATNAISKAGSAPSGGDPFKLTELISRLGEAGVALNALSFSKFSTAARSQLSKLGSELERLSKKLEKLGPHADIAEIIKKQLDAMSKVRDQIFANAASSGSQFTSLLSEAGVSDNFIVANTDKKKLTAVLALYHTLLDAKQALSVASGLEDIAAASGNVAKAEFALKKAVDATNAKFSDRLSTINEMFAADLSFSDFASVDETARDSWYALAAAISAEMEQVSAAGKSASGLSVSALSDIKRQVGYLASLDSVFIKLGTAFRDSIYQGAQDAYTAISDLFSNLNISFSDFADLPDALQKTYSRVAAELSAIEKINGMALPASMREILNTLAADSSPEQVTAIIAQLTQAASEYTGANRAAIQKAIENIDPESQVDATHGVRDAVFDTGERIIATMRGATPGGKPDKGLVTAIDGMIDGFHSRVKDSVTEVSSLTIAADKAATSSDLSSQGAGEVARRAAANREYQQANVLKNTSTRVQAGRAFGDARINNLATSSQQLMAAELFAKIEKANSDILSGAVTGDSVRRLQLQVDLWKYQLEQVTAAVARQAEAARNAGQAMADNFNDSASSGLKDFLKGKASFKDGVKGLLDTITSDIVDTFVNGLMGKITGPDSPIHNFISSLGEMIFGGADQVGSKAGSKLDGPMSALSKYIPANDLMPTEPSSQQPGVLNRVGNFGKNIAGGVGRMLGFGVGFGDGGIASPLTKVADNFKTVSADLAPGLMDNVPKLADSITGSMPDLTSALKNVGGAAGGGMGGAGLWGALGGLFGTLIGGFFANGGPVSGPGRVSGPGTGTSDSILAMVSNDEYIVRSKQAKKHKGLLDAINSGRLPAYARGGMVSTAMIAPLQHMSSAAIKPVAANQNATTVNLQVVGDVSRQTRSEIVRMLPTIAMGVNQENREKGYK